MEDFEEEAVGGKKQIKTNDSKKKVLKAEKKKDEGAAKGSPKRKNAAKKNTKKEEKKDEKGQSKKNKEETGEDVEAMMLENDNNSEQNSDENFESPTKLKSTKKKPQAKKNQKAKGGSGRDDSTITVLEYMKKQNRPYSLLNILDNLHGEIKKTQGQKILDQLTEEGDLQMKEYGKAKIYLINQKNIPVVDPKELENLKVSLEARKADHSSLANEIKALKKKEMDLNNQLNNEQLEQEIEKFENLLKECDEKIEFYKSPEYVKIPDNVINEAEIKRNKYEKECKKRRKFCMDMINQLAEGMDKKPREIEEMIGIERD